MGVTQSTWVYTITTIHMKELEGQVTQAKRKAGEAQKAKLVKGEQVTSIECISAAGRLLPLLVIFKRL